MNEENKWDHRILAGVKEVLADCIMIVSMNISHFVKICQVLTILHQLICSGVANFGTRCSTQQRSIIVLLDCPHHNSCHRLIMACECFFWYWLTRIVPDKGPLNGYCYCYCINYSSMINWLTVFKYILCRSFKFNKLLIQNRMLKNDHN